MPTPGDVLIAAALTVLSQIDAWQGSEWIGNRAANAAFLLIASVSLLWRRSRPLEVLAVVIAALVMQSLLVGTSESPTELFVVLVAAYSAAAYAANLPAVVALLAAGIATHDLMDPKIKTFGDAAYDSTIVTMAVVLGLAARARTHWLHTAQRATEAQAELAEKNAAAAVAQERSRIARELHDVVSHSLGIVVLQAGAAEQILDRDPEQARAAMRLIRSTGLEAITEMSRLLGVIRGEPEASRSPQPSLDGLDTLLQRARDAGLIVEFTVTGERRRLPQAIELSAYRIVQEALTNVIKHAPAARTAVTLEYSAHDLRVCVVNDVGTGAPADLTGGRGLYGVRERVAVFGGRLDAGPIADGQWQLLAALPVS